MSSTQRAGLFGWFKSGGEKPVDILPVRVGGNEYRQGPANTANIFGADQTLIWLVVGIMAWGVVMVFSASIAMSDNPRFGNISHYYFFQRHLLSLLLGSVAAVLAFQVPMAVWERWAPWMFIASIILLIAVLIPHVGTVVNGARRWLSLGIMNFQPSELAKLAVLMYASDYMVRKMEVKERFFRAVLPMGLAVGIVGALLLAEPDMGAFMVIAVIAMGILFLGGVNARMFFIIAAVLVGAFGTIVMTSEWRRERIFAYLDPWSEQHALGKGYQLSHSLIAIGRGEIFGVGLGGSVEKLHWLPEAHTDFLLAVIGEELGLVGIVLLLGMFFFMIRRIVEIGRHSIRLERLFSGLVAQGVAIWMGFQTFINVGVNLGALPTKGLTLPLMSFGGSAVLMNLVAIAIVLRIDCENKALGGPRV